MRGWTTQARGGQLSYRSYLLRLWATHGRDAVVWRASLEGPQTGQRRGFASLRELFASLEEETRQGTPGNSLLNTVEEGGETEQPDQSCRTATAHGGPGEEPRMPGNGSSSDGRGGRPG